MLSHSRTLYNRVLNRNQPSPAEVARAIKIGSELKAMQGQAGWKHITEFMEKNRIGTHLMMEKEVSTIRGWTIFALFGAFSKYLMLLFENRAYNKIKTYVDVTIQKGEQLAAARAKREGRE